ncbi:COG3772 Phage-related lysozyme (muraminidase) [uncultured Caudovirales phage]|uniref:Endolysin n=1 Tax=uncultured Caudovirales phage TaxID=2100421 RepID=A0A6J5M6T5_9CAUD|nr:COG3772 Phage-related lysozyme (muraminidase) [uncultured Caudovirales phage]
MKKTSKVGRDLIKKYEGYSANAYVCPAGVATIGFGTTKIQGKPVQMGMKITTDEANAFLEEDLFVFEEAVNSLVKVDITQNEFDALVSFTYNVGIGAFKGSTLLKMLNQNKKSDAAEQFLRWNKANKKELPGLTRRRTAERELFLKV